MLRVMYCRTVWKYKFRAMGPKRITPPWKKTLLAGGVTKKQSEKRPKETERTGGCKTRSCQQKDKGAGGVRGDAGEARKHDGDDESRIQPRAGFAGG